MKLLIFRALAAALFLGGILAAIPAAHGAAAARASLSSDTMSAGDAIQFTISITGARQVQPPERIDVDGLAIDYSGYSQRTAINNGQVDASVDITYTLQAIRSGSYVIPVIEVKTEAGVLRTEPLKLIVHSGSSAPSPSGNAPSTADSDDGARGPAEYAEITVAKTSVYVGENVPVELRLFTDVENRARPEQMPELNGEGFTKQKFLRPREERARRNGREYQVIVFRTAICPSRAGRVTLGPSELKFVASVPRAKRARSRDPFESLFNDPFGPFTQSQERQTTAPAVELDVKPLPAEGRPKSFAGAVGKFKFSAEGSPARVKIGDPITMRMKITGKGNFDRLSEPALIDAKGWHAYPASVDFSADDELALTGTKKFEAAIVPEEAKSAMPVFEFSFFDPETAKYVTQRSDAGPLSVEGTATKTAPVLPSAQPLHEAAPATPAPAAPLADILGLRYEAGPKRTTFAPLYESREFWLAQAIPALGLVVLLAMRRWRKRAVDTSASALRRERAELWRQLQGSLSDADFFEKGTRWVQVETALHSGGPAEAVDITATGRRPLDEPTAAAIEELFQARGELLFAGGSAAGNGSLSPGDRQRFLQAMTHFQNAAAKH